MKKLICLIILSLSSSAFGATYLSFKPYSSATEVTCNVTSGSTKSNGVFYPNINTSKDLVLGTKSLKNYSTSIVAGDSVLINCFGNVTPSSGALALVKAFWEGVSSTYITIQNRILSK